ncbi:O-methyltransferase [Paenibacillus sp.]|jgi:predicted O-methyltransferase YrrM|uniref:O-methyltransferase n=1 Tax=Paenibacillus sp. TaxID=58172 RepID=UPI0028367653|nr:O-methyltransferase [Paenibacillus sp.]MDR0270600.1 O-methyltransferase [Paenibacillus sp.]
MSPEEYVDHFLDNDGQLARVKQNIADKGMPEISIAPGYGRLLTMLVAATKASQVLEIGALGGYSGICLARGLAPEGRLTSLELKQDFADVALANLTEAGFGKQVEYMIGQATDSLESLKQAGRKFDFFFIDADKENYLVYLEYAIELANPGAIIAGDNTFLRGRTLNPDKNGPSVQAIRRFNEQMATDDRLIGTILPAYDGLAVAMVKPQEQ